jgi:hypothetical protein
MIFTLVKAHRIGFTKIWDTPLALRVPYFGKALVLGLLPYTYRAGI